jgi:5-methylcytosine-specific restriction endonuclease McrA
MPVPPKTDPPRHCSICGTLLERKRFGTRLEDRTRFLSRKTCGQSCGNSRAEVTKSALHYRAAKHRATRCRDCEATTGLHVHHLDRNPANNDPTNLVTLCASCHLRLHWREDRDLRVAAVRRGVTTRQRSAAGSGS